VPNMLLATFEEMRRLSAGDTEADEADDPMA
jgi:hypothetical protein